MTVAIEQLYERNPSRYSLVLALAKRANDISEGSQPLVKSSSKRVSTIALEEFEQGKVFYSRES